MKKRIAFLGSGEMARHIAHYMVEDDQFEVVGYFDDYTEVGSTVHSYPIIGKIDDVEVAYKEGKFDELVNAIGYTRFEYRKLLFERFEHTVPFGTFIHSTALVDSTAEIGKGVIIFPFALIYAFAKVEDNVFIQVRSSITDATVRRHSLISAHVVIAGRSEVGECCFMGITTTVSSDVKITDHVQTGAGCVVVKNIDEPGIYVGVPAKKLKDA